jgi:hypothetical protein
MARGIAGWRVLSYNPRNDPECCASFGVLRVVFRFERINPGRLTSMTTSRFSLLRGAIASLLLAGGMAAQTPQGPRVNFPAPSPASTVKQKVGFTDIEVVYSRPGVKGRKVFGGLEPFGKVWRTGANSATKITFSTPVKFGAKELPAGSYALFSIPGETEWTVIFNKATGDWGAYSYKEENDVLRVTAKPVKLTEPVESFTIDINDITTDAATLNLIWGNTRVPAKFTVDVVPNVVAQIDAALASGAKLPEPFYFQAALFYYNNGLDIQKAREWIGEATKGEKPPFFMLYWKAKILAKAGDKDGAIAAARQSIAAADGAAKDEYTRLNETLIASLK